MNTIWSKYKWHIPPFIIFVIAIVISLCILANDAEKIALSLSVLGTGFAIFQFWIAEVNTNNRRKYDLRFLAIKEFNENSVLLISSIDKYRAVIDIDIDEMCSEIAFRIDNLNASLGNSISILFPEIIDKIQYKNFLNIDLIISNITFQFRNNYFIGGDKDASINNGIIKNDWNNDVYDKMLEFIKAKSELYELLKEYL